MIRAGAGITAVVGAVALVALVGAASGAEPKLVFNLPAAIIYVQDKSFASENDKNRCQVATFVEFPKITRAVSYKIIVRLPKQNNREMQFVAPPFETTGFTARYRPTKDFARFSIGAYSTGEGCAAALGVTAGTAVIVSAKVSLDEAFTQRFRESSKPPYRCVASPDKRSLSLKTLFGSLSDPRFVIVRRLGSVTSIDKGSKQPVSVFTNRYATAGTTIKTGPNSVVQIGAVTGGDGGGRSVLVGPNTTVRLTNTGFEILESSGGGFKINRPPGPDYKVQTDCAVLSARG
jgi:hypothetical protein